MTSEQDPKQSAAPGQPESGHDQSVFLYKDSGIQERTGPLPLWLVAVAVILLIWGVYYLVAFWSPPPL